MTYHTIQDPAGGRHQGAKRDECRAVKVHGKKALQHNIKYPQLSSSIINRWTTQLCVEECVWESILASEQIWVSICQVGGANLRTSSVCLLQRRRREDLPLTSDFKQSLVTCGWYVTQLIRTPCRPTHWKVSYFRKPLKWNFSAISKDSLTKLHEIQKMCSILIIRNEFPQTLLTKD